MANFSSLNQTKYITIKYRDGVEIITMNRPDKKNAMNTGMMTEITFALREADLDDNVGIVVLTGAGDYYCSGNDMSSTDDFDLTLEERADKAVEIGSNFVNSLIDFKKILIAIVNGSAVGIAVTTLCLCDVVYAVNTAKFWTPFITLGLCAEACSSYTFPSIMGFPKAGEILYMGKEIAAQEAKEIGLVAEVFSQEEMDDIIWPKILNLVPYKETLIANKKLIRKFSSDFLHKVNEAEWEELKRRMASETFLNAVMKFMQRSKI